MKGTLCSTTTDYALDTYDMEKLADRYATEPMSALSISLRHPDDEMLHTSFEHAISDRVEALHKRLSRLTTSPLTETLRERTTDTLGNTISLMTIQPATATASLRQSWRRRIIYSCLALIFTLLGFDLMGLLVIHMH